MEDYYSILQEDGLTIDDTYPEVLIKVPSSWFSPEGLPLSDGFHSLVWVLKVGRILDRLFFSKMEVFGTEMDCGETQVRTGVAWSPLSADPVAGHTLAWLAKSLDSVTAEIDLVVDLPPIEYPGGPIHYLPEHGEIRVLLMVTGEIEKAQTIALSWLIHHDDGHTIRVGLISEVAIPAVPYRNLRNIPYDEYEALVTAAKAQFESSSTPVETP